MACVGGRQCKHTDKTGDSRSATSSVAVGSAKSTATTKFKSDCAQTFISDASAHSQYPTSRASLPHWNSPSRIPPSTNPVFRTSAAPACMYGWAAYAPRVPTAISAYGARTSSFQ